MKTVKSLLVLGAITLMVSSCYFQPVEDGVMVLELGAVDDFTAMQFGTAAQPDNPGNSGGQGNNPNSGVEPTHAVISLFQGEAPFVREGETDPVTAKVEMSGERPQTVEIGNIPVGDGYVVWLKLGIYDVDTGEFQVLLEDDSAKFKIFSGRNTTVRVNPRPVDPEA